MAVLVHYCFFIARNSRLLVPIYAHAHPEEDASYSLVPSSLSLLKGVAKLKMLQDEGFRHSSASLGRIHYPWGGEVTIKCRHLFSGLMTCWIIYKELMYSSRLIQFKLSSVGSPIFNIPKTSRH